MTVSHKGDAFDQPGSDGEPTFAAAMEPELERRESNEIPVRPSGTPFIPAVINDRYRIERELGRGGMGRVLLAHDLKLNRKVAVKVVSKGIQTDEDRYRLETEARAAGALQHANVVAVHDFGMVDGNPFIVLEYLKGRTLHEWALERQRSQPEIFDVAVQIVRGIAAAHAEHIVHRDLKPSNVFVTHEGCVKILDFGIASPAVSLIPPRANTVSAMSQGVSASAVKGTVGYMAPEQIHGGRPDARSDIFSFGVILFELLAGHAPFPGPSAVEVAYSTLHATPPPLPPLVSPEFGRVVTRCLEKEPGRRFQSSEDLLFHLETVQPRARSRRRWRSGRAVRIGAVLAGVVGATLLAVSWLRRPVATAPLSFQQVTFQRGAVTSARFGIADKNIYYSEAWDGDRPRIYSTRLDTPESHRVEVRDAVLAAVSAKGQLAILRQPRFEVFDFAGTLAVMPPLGGAPRDVVERAEHADFAPNGEQLAVARGVSPQTVIEFPVGTRLHATMGKVTDVKVSPSGRAVAFVEYAASGQGQASLLVVERGAQAHVLTEGWTEIAGIAWHPSGNEIWFAGVKGTGGSGTALHGVDLQGHTRWLVEAAGSLKLQDVSRDGTALVTQPVRQAGIGVAVDGEEQQTDLSWLDMPLLTDLSEDGRSILFTSVGAAAANAPVAYLRAIDGSAAVALGTGLGAALSPDGRWALIIPVPADSSKPLTLVPTSAGDVRKLDSAGIAALRARFFPDGKRILIAGEEPGHGVRLYVRAVEGGAARAISDEGVSSSHLALSRDGGRVAALDRSFRTTIYPVDGGKPESLDAIPPGFAPMAWLEDGSLLVFRPIDIPAHVHRLSPDGRKLTAWRTIAPSAPGATTGIARLFATADGRVVAYNYAGVRAHLFVVQGVR